jgi:hypothetical protein
MVLQKKNDEKLDIVYYRRKTEAVNEFYFLRVTFDLDPGGTR